jgi:hypothetical protein
LAFDFDAGGWSKTKPLQTGVELWDAESSPIPNARVFVSAEMASSSGNPILVTLQTPWLVSSVSSVLLQARDLRHSESLFVQVLTLDPQRKDDWQIPSHFQQLLLESGILASPGKLGSYGSPTNVKVEAVQDTSTLEVTFTLHHTTPSVWKESEERRLWIKPIAIDKDTLVLLVVGTTQSRFVSQQAAFQKVVNSFTAVAAPTTR